ncbi:MAG: aminodeoxychorismate/anthranilate synthase component II [Hyphomicrobiales bacterium]|nr:aminodeoxychorismate/anthranilate synthase component II [Hyphomicrobiales bacterium]
MILLIDNYDSFTYNLVHYFGELGAECRVVRNDQITVAEALANRPQAIVMSPGPCNPDQAGICLDLVRANREMRVPLLGVCLGHQTIGQAYGGCVIRAPKMMHGKLSTIHNEGVGLFSGLPPQFEATRYHSLIVEAETLPDGLVPTAHTNDGLIMAMQHASDPVYGVQFHPESIASNFGHAILANFLTLARINWRATKSSIVLPQLTRGSAHAHAQP